MVHIADFLGVCSPQDVNNIPHSEALLCSGHARQELLGIYGAILHCRYWMQAVIAITTVFLLVLFTKVGQQSTTAANNTFTIVHNLLKLLAGNTTFLLIRF